MTIPSVSTNALGYGAFLGLYANLRYQLLCGLERSVTGYFDVIGVALFFSAALRYDILGSFFLVNCKFGSLFHHIAVMHLCYILLCQ